MAGEANAASGFPKGEAEMFVALVGHFKLGRETRTPSKAQAPPIRLSA